jgi:surfeit locus 1 family protein
MPNREPPPGASPITRRRFRPRLLPTLVTFAAVAAFVTAGNWQHARMRTKEVLAAAYDAASRAAPTPLPDVGAGGDWARERFRRVSVAGEFDSGHQIHVDNKINAGRVGYDVVTPLRLADGRIVLVDRGWIAAGPSRAVLPEAPPPSGEVTVEGRINLAERYLELGSTGGSGPLWQNLDPSRFAAATGLNVLPVYIEQTAPPKAGDGLLRSWPRPDFGVEKHRIYMLQWYAFAIVAVVLWTVVNWRGSPASGRG